MQSDGVTVMQTYQLAASKVDDIISRSVAMFDGDFYGMPKKYGDYFTARSDLVYLVAQGLLAASKVQP